MSQNVAAILSYKGQIKWQHGISDNECPEWFDDKEIRSLEYNGGPGRDADGIFVSYDWIMSIHVNGVLAGAVDIYETKNTIQFINIISTKIINAFTTHMLNAILLYAETKKDIKFIFPIRPYQHMRDLLVKKYDAEQMHHEDMEGLVDKFIDSDNFSDCQVITFFRTNRDLFV